MIRHRSARSRRTVGTWVTLAVLVLAGCSSAKELAGSARPLASPPDVTSIDLQTVASVNLRAEFNESPQSINSYWTADRTRKAIPINPGTPTPNPVPTKTVTVTPSARPPATRSSTKTITAPAPAPRTSTQIRTATRTVTAQPPAPPTTTRTVTAPAPAPRTTTAPTPSTTVPAPAPSTRATPSRKATTTVAPLPPRDPGANTIIAPTRGKPDPAVALANSTSGKKFGKPGLTRSTAGRLYFVHGNENYVCSATVVNSSTKNIVATAGHCVWDTEHGTGWSRNLLFIPDDSGRGANAPYGRWPILREVALNDFTKGAGVDARGSVSGAGWAYDTAFLKIATVGGRRIQDVTGGQGIAFGIGVTSILDIGYPTAPPFDGSSERFCSARSWGTAQFGDRSISCKMTPGCSGGGWLADFNAASGAGYLIGTNSFGDGSFLAAAQMGSAALNLYHYAIASK